MALAAALLPSLGFSGAAAHAALRSGPVSMQVMGQNEQKDKGRYMYGEPYAPAGMGREYINADGARKPLADFVGASEELNLAAYFKGETIEPWDPMGFSLLSKVSANNPDVAWLREAELKHGRICMLAFVGIQLTSAGIHWDAPVFADATAVGWPLALGQIQQDNYGIFAQGFLAAGFVEGVSNSQIRRGGGSVGWWDGLWFGERKPEGGEKAVVAGDLGFDPLRLMPQSEPAASRMRLKELKNGRLAMLAVMGLFVEYLYTGKDSLAA